MKNILILLALTFTYTSEKKDIFTFSKKSNIREWRIVNDGVMGGISTSSIVLNEAGNGMFSGHVLLDYNGGFASIQYNTNIKVENKKYVVLRVKGDKKNYEFRLKSDVYQPESYVKSFATTGEWEVNKLEISDFYPQFRGRRLRMANFNFDTIEQVSFLIANKEEEDFQLLIDYIVLE